MLKPIDVKANILPVFPQLVHTEPYEGPCRVGEMGTLTPEADRQRGQEQFGAFVSTLKEHLPSAARLLEPVYLEWHDDFVLPKSELAKLIPAVYDADLVLIGAAGLPQYPAITIAHEFGKPVGMMPTGPGGWMTGVDIAAYLRSRGMEGYAFFDYADLSRYISLLQVRKAFRQTRFFIAGEGNSLVPSGVVSSLWDVEGLKQRYGIDYALVPADELTRQMDALTEEDRAEARRITTRLIENAEAVHMSEEDILPSVEFYLAARKALEKHEANAFVIPCFEICAKQVMQKRRVTFCLTHTLLKDAGIPSACEADVNALMAISLLTYVARKSVYMGNTYLVDRDRNILAVHHDVPGLKMKGLDAPDLPYQIRSFTVGGWGVTVRYDFSRDLGETVTLARFNPVGTKVLVARGEIAGSGGVDEVGCSLSVHIKLANDIRDFFYKQRDFGHHLAMVYGDYIEDIKMLGEIMGFEVVEA